MITINAIGDNCPIPVIKAKKAIQALTAPDTIEVIVDNEIAVQNVTKLGTGLGGKVTSQSLGDKEFKVTIQMETILQESSAADSTVSCTSNASNNTVVVFASDRMGSGNDALGTVLMKGFIFAITQLDTLPKTMLFYNGGATLTAEGSDSIADLKSLEEQGVEILTCGTCLNYYELTDKLEVGTVTNMYSIVEKMAGADKILQP
ncbi:MAG: sulfurtransferase-like selenium metabolism protein YedF [Lachnospiraceae bacterium]